MAGAPRVIVIAGPNGAGKSTSAPALLKGRLKVDEFVNADAIARGLSEFHPERVAFEAGRIMLRRLKALAKERADFAFETTLASRSFAPWLAGLRESGYQVGLVFLYLASADLAVARVVERVRLGGHSVPEDTVRRRYRAGLVNFFRLYRPITDTWAFYDNSDYGKPVLVADGSGERNGIISQADLWRSVVDKYA